MTLSQYRCVAAHMIYWKLGLSQALTDATVTEDRETVLTELWQAGYRYDPETDTLAYED